MRSLLVTLAFVACAACTHAPPLDTVANVDLARYEGRWYEAARLPAPFEEGCRCTTATYDVRDDGKLDVLNRCVKGDQVDEAKGTATVVGPATLDVKFFGPFGGDYNVMALDDAYGWALVGSKNRKYAWILSRTPQVSADVAERLVGELRRQGFDTAPLLWVDHSRCGA